MSNILDRVKYRLKMGKDFPPETVEELLALYETKMSCGHLQRYLVSSDEGTTYCMECAWRADIKYCKKLLKTIQFSIATQPPELSIKNLKLIIEKEIENGHC